MEDLLHYAHCIKKRNELSTYLEQQPSLYHQDKYRRRHVKRVFFEGKKDERLLHMAASFDCKFATLSNNTSSGKAVFSGTLEKQTQLACVVSAGSWGRGRGQGWMGGGLVSCLSKERTENSNTKSTGKMRNPKYLYISTNYCLLTRNQIKTFVLTQIHKCKRSVNRLFKGYLLIIYMKTQKWLSSLTLGLENELLKT